MSGSPHPLEGRGQDNWNLVLRTLLPLNEILFCSFPFVATYVLRKLQCWAGQLLFTKAGMHIAVVVFIRELNLDFPLGPMRATPLLLLACVTLEMVRLALRVMELYGFLA